MAVSEKCSQRQCPWGRAWGMLRRALSQSTEVLPRLPLSTAGPRGWTSRPRLGWTKHLLGNPPPGLSCLMWRQQSHQEAVRVRGARWVEGIIVNLEVKIPIF